MQRSTAARPAPRAGMAGRRRDGTARTAAMVVAARAGHATGRAAACAAGRAAAHRPAQPGAVLPWTRRHRARSAAARTLPLAGDRRVRVRSEEHTSELQSLMRISYAVLCLKTKKQTTETQDTNS